MRTHGMSNTKLYRAWSGMKQRCLNKNDSEFSNYGGRGITICDKWMHFKPFAEWALANGYDPSLTIERINVNEGYCPDNCKWATLKEQMNNKRNNIVINGEFGEITLAKYCEERNISYNTAQMRYYRGRHSIDNPVNFRRRPVIRDDGKQYESIAEAARDNMVSETSIRDVCYGDRGTTANHSFVFLRGEGIMQGYHEGYSFEENLCYCPS